MKILSKPAKNASIAYNPDDYPYFSFKWGYCPDCGHMVDESNYRKCPECGRRIDWESTVAVEDE